MTTTNSLAGIGKALESRECRLSLAGSYPTPAERD